MSTHPRRRLALVCAVAGALATGALAGPAMAASDVASPAAEADNASGPPQELVTPRKAGGDRDIGFIIAVL